MELKVLSSEELKNRGINKKLREEKNLLDDSNYLKIQGLYQMGLDYYLLKNTSIKSFDEKIVNSGLDFGLIDSKMKNIHHNASYLGLNYIYVRNFLFIEKLNIEYINYINSKIVNNNGELDANIVEIVKNTYKDIINDNYKHNEYKEKTTTCYGSVIPSNIVDSDTLVLCIHYGKNTNKLDDKAFMDNYKKKREFLNSIIEEMQNSLSNELGIKVKVLVRDYVGE